MKHRFAKGVMTVAVLLAAVGCSRLIRNQFANPVIELKDVRLRGIGLQGGSLDVVLDVFNPNPYRLDASRLTYRLMVDTSNVAEGSIDQRVTLETQKKSEIILPVTFSTKQLIGAASALQKSGSVDYTVTGEVTVATPFGNFTRPYLGKGRFDSLRPF